MPWFWPIARTSGSRRAKRSVDPPVHSRPSARTVLHRMRQLAVGPLRRARGELGVEAVGVKERRESYVLGRHHPPGFVLQQIRLDLPDACHARRCLIPLVYVYARLFGWQPVRHDVAEQLRRTAFLALEYPLQFAALL